MEIEVRLFASFREGRWKSKRLQFSDDLQIIDILDTEIYGTENFK